MIFFNDFFMIWIYELENRVFDFMKNMFFYDFCYDSFYDVFMIFSARTALKKIIKKNIEIS